MILVFGSINIDIIVPVDRLPTPGETVLGGDYDVLPGGKGANQALAARRDGAATVMAGAVGTDAYSDAALALLQRDGVDLTLLRRVERFAQRCVGRVEAHVSPSQIHVLNVPIVPGAARLLLQTRAMQLSREPL